MNAESRIIHKYPYRLKIELVACFTFFLIICVSMVPASDISVILNSIFGIYVLVLIIESIKSYFDPFHKKIGFTENSIIGPKHSVWFGDMPYKEIEIYFSEISELELLVGRNLSIRVATTTNEMDIMYSKLDPMHFKEVYDILAKKLNRPLFDEIAPSYLKQ